VGRVVHNVGGHERTSMPHDLATFICGHAFGLGQIHLDDAVGEPGRHGVVHSGRGHHEPLRHLQTIGSQLHFRPGVNAAVLTPTRRGMRQLVILAPQVAKVGEPARGEDATTAVLTATVALPKRKWPQPEECDDGNLQGTWRGPSYTTSRCALVPRPHLLLGRP
jgi:hypothetical protein